jgi:hypothetical protein
MPGLDPGIHLLAKMMDCRVKPAMTPWSGGSLERHSHQ